MNEIFLTNDILNSLIASGEISSYKYEEILDYPDIESRKTEKVELIFSSGKKLIIETFCSGCLQNTSLLFK